MVVAKSAVREFLARPSRNSDKAKRVSEESLDKRLARAGAKFVTKPLHAQKVCWLLGNLRGSYMFLLGMGAGKTKLALDLIKHFQNDERKAALVLVPYSVNVEAWVEEGHIHRPDLPIQPLTMVDRDERVRAFTEAMAPIIVSTYQGLAQLVCYSKLNRKGKKKWAIDHNLLRKLAADLGTVVFDEPTELLKSHRSLYYRIARALSKVVPHRFGLTGTPFDDPGDLWSQFHVIDLGETLGETVGLFREAYFREEEGYWGGVTYHLRKSMRGKLARRIKNRSIRFSEEECQDLPPFQGGIDAPRFMLRPVIFPAENWEYYERLVDELRDAEGNRSLTVGTYVRMRQLASGYIPVEDGPDIVFKKNPKLDALIDLLREIPKGERVIVTNIFHKTGHMLEHRFKEEGVEYVRVYGKTVNKAEAIRSFKAKGGPRVLLGSEAIGYGLNLQHTARHMVFYESTDRPTRRRQMERRIRRRDAMGRTMFWDVVVRVSVETRILRSLHEGVRLLDLLLDGKVRPEDLLFG